MGYELIAAVDLGSNSFRLEIGRVMENQIYTLDSLKESVRLASGLDGERNLDENSQRRALEALSRFGERLRGFSPEAVRAVATNTLRVARNAVDFLPRAEAALGFPIEVIAGREEARLIYIGAAHSLPPAPHKRLVIDIGGGSTEFIIGKRFAPQLMESLYMGCVSWSLRFFPDGRINRKRFAEAQVAAASEIQAIAHDYGEAGWREAVGSSGTARALADLLELNGLNPDGETGITHLGLERLRAALIKAGSAEALALDGLKPDRIPVLPGGLAIMCAVCETLDLERMTYAEGALRLGVLYDLLGRFHDHDMRDASVLQFQRRYQVDVRQAERVEATARAVCAELGGVGEDDLHFLGWGAKLHEIGVSIAHSGYHKHGAYIVTFADMPGFSKKDQARLALLILSHRGKLDRITGLPPGDVAWKLVFGLRLAALLHRSRDDLRLPPLRVKAGPASFHLELPADWLESNPLTAAAMAEEASVWRGVGFDFRLRRRGGE